MHGRMRSIQITLISMVVVLVLGQLGFAQQGDSAVIAIRCGKLIDGHTAQPQQDMVIIIRGERIEAVGKAANITIPKGATILDLSRATVLPMLPLPMSPIVVMSAGTSMIPHRFRAAAHRDRRHNGRNGDARPFGARGHRRCHL